MDCVMRGGRRLVNDLLEVSWASVRQGNQVIAGGRPRRVVLVRRTPERQVDVVLEDGSRERHEPDDRACVLLAYPPAGVPGCTPDDAGV